MQRKVRVGHSQGPSAWTFSLILSAVLVGCAATGDRSPAGPTTHHAPPTPSGKESSADHMGAFAGVWEACEGATSPEQCTRYVLVQRGHRICGTWSYFATGDRYEGRVAGKTSSPTEARRTHVCGRPGSEARTECADGWDVIDKPLRLCGGKLGDLDTKDGKCHADFVRVADSSDLLAELEKQPWVEACLSGDEAEVTR